MTDIDLIFRFLRKNKVFTLLNTLGLTFGFCCAILISVHIVKEKSYNASIPDCERVFYLLEKSPDSPMGNTFISYALSPILANSFPEIEYFSRTENFSSFSNCIVSYSSTDNNISQSFNENNFYLADKDLFKIIQYPFTEGSAETALATDNSIVISTETAKKYFGNQSALGKTLILNSQQLFTISGVVEIPNYVTFNFSMVAPITSLRSASRLNGWDSNGQPMFKLRENVDYVAFNKKIEKFYAEIKPEQVRNPEKLTLTLLPAVERRLYYNSSSLYLLIFIGIIVLIVSVLNYVNLSTSMVRERSSEIAMKKVSGASKRSIGWEFVRETAIVSFISVALGAILARFACPVFLRLTGSDIQSFLISHWTMFIGCSLLLWLFVTVLAGFYPAVVMSGICPLILVKKENRSFSGNRGKNVLISSQFVMSFILVITTLMVNKQYRFMANMPLGFEDKMVMQVPLSNSLKTNYQSLKNELAQIPGVVSMCSASSMPGGISNHCGITWIDDKNEKRNESVAYAIVSDNYTQTFNMKMVDGNEFISEKSEEMKGVIINESAAKQLGYANPVGKQINFWGKESTIIGVVKDFQNNFMFNNIKPMIMSAHPDNQHFTKFLYIRLSTTNTMTTIHAIEKSIKQITPGCPFDYSFTNDEVASYINDVKQINTSLNFASIVSILLAIVGLIALTYQTTLLRTKEIGVRKVNGAKIFEIILLLNKSLIRNIIVAYAVACPIAYYIVHYLQQGIGNKTNITVWVFLVAGITVGAFALLTVSFQSWKAATRNPVEALRYE